MSNRPTQLSGLLVAMPAPFDEDEQFMPGTFKRLLRDLVDAGMHGFLVNGTMGAQPLLCLSAFEQITEAASEALKGSGCPLMIGCGDTSHQKTLEKMRIAEQYDIDYLTLTSPFYFQYTDEELSRYFRRLADATDKDILLYDNPDCTHNKLSLALVEELSQVPNIRGIKCSAFDLHYIRMLRERLAARGDFSLICGVPHFMDLLMVDGVQAFMDGLWAMTPRLATEMLQAGRAGDSEGARRAVFKMVSLVDRMVELGLWGAYTAGMNILGYEGQYGVAPLGKPDSETVRRMRQVLAEEDLAPHIPAALP